MYEDVEEIKGMIRDIKIEIIEMEAKIEKNEFTLKEMALELIEKKRRSIEVLQNELKRRKVE